MIKTINLGKIREINIEPPVQTKKQKLTNQDLRGKLALITGASGDIGQSIAYKLAAQGASLCLHGFRNKLRLDKLVSDLQSLYGNFEQKFDSFLLDLAQPEAGIELIKRCQNLGRNPDIFISNAGTANIGLINDLSLTDYQKLQYLHLQTPIFACKTIFPHLLQQKWGRIVIISSIWGLTGASCEVAYSAVKAGAIGLVKSLAKEWGPSGVTVNAVAPGVIDTTMNADLDELTIAELIETTPVGRLGKPDDVAETVAFFTSPKSSFITGQILSPNGGIIT